MKFEKLELGFSQMNCYIIYDEVTKEAGIIDPGFDFYIIEKFLVENQLIPKYILLTHAHADHIGACEELKNKYKDLKLGLHPEDVEMLKNPELNLSKVIQREPVSLSDDFTIKSGDLIEIGNMKIKGIHTPGHTAGGICFLVEDILFSGDTLFKQSIGRTDLYMGDSLSLISSIKNKLLVLDDKTQVYPGHGPETTIGFERERNPFL